MDQTIAYLFAQKKGQGEEEEEQEEQEEVSFLSPGSFVVSACKMWNGVFSFL